MELIRRDWKLKRSVHNPRTDPPIMNAVQIREVDTFAPFKPPGSGYVFFHGRGAGRPVPCNSLPSRDVPKGHQKVGLCALWPAATANRPPVHLASAPENANDGTDHRPH